MHFNSNKIKIYFEKPKYSRNGKEVTCSLRYVIRIPNVKDTRKDDSENCYISTFISLGSFISTGTATCNSEDVFNKQLGRDIAKARAEANAYGHARRMVDKYVKRMAQTYYDMTLEFAEKADHVRRNSAEYGSRISND